MFTRAYGRNSCISKQAANKLIGLELNLSDDRYVIEYVEGTRNVSADILTGWAVKTRDTAGVARMGSVMYAPIGTVHKKEFEWPSRTDMIKSRKSSKDEYPKKINMENRMIRSPKGHFAWVTLDADVEMFCESWIYCFPTDSGEGIPRTLGYKIYGEMPNEVVHFDFCYIGKSTEGYIYVIVLKDDMGSFVRLYAFEVADADEVEEALVDW